MDYKEEISVVGQKMHLQSNIDYDLIVIGAGPAGMSAALCARRALLNVLIIDRNLPGGEAATAYKISNYLGFPKGILGSDLTRAMETHLDDYNVEISCESVEDIFNHDKPVKTITTDLGNKYRTKAIILAIGLEPTKLSPQLDRNFLGRGLSYYAQSDAQSYAGKDVAVIGGGNCACYAADYLSQFVNKLYLVHSADYIKSVANLKQRVLQNPKIDVLWDTELVDIFGIDKLEKIKLKNKLTHQQTWIDVKGVFVYIGRVPPKDIVSLDVKVDEKGFIITDEYMRTNIPGIYAAGDIRSKQIRQIATAVADGMIAAINVDRDCFH
jgi:thioredoxin reductase (NADPH)